MDRPRVADDFATIRARMEELRQDRERPEHAKKVPPEPVPAVGNRIGQVSVAVRRLRNAAW
jgi:hypothetical protein